MNNVARRLLTCTLLCIFGVGYFYDAETALVSVGAIIAQCVITLFPFWIAAFALGLYAVGLKETLHELNPLRILKDCFWDDEEEE